MAAGGAAVARPMVHLVRPARAEPLAAERQAIHQRPAVPPLLRRRVLPPAAARGKSKRRLRPQLMLLESLAQASFTMLRQANRRHDVVAVQVTDPRELELPALGRLVLEDAETGEIVEVSTGDARKRAAFAQRQAKAQSDLARVFRTAGIDAIQLRTDQPYTFTLAKFFETRERRRLRG